jgi:hypothetical protein
VWQEANLEEYRRVGAESKRRRAVRALGGSLEAG